MSAACIAAMAAVQTDIAAATRRRDPDWEPGIDDIEPWVVGCGLGLGLVAALLITAVFFWWP